MAIQAVHWALGTLLNVGEIQQEAHRRAIAFYEGTGGDEFAESAEYAALSGVPPWQACNTIMSVCKVSNREGYLGVWKDFFSSHLSFIKPHAGAREVIELIRQRSIKQAIVSPHSSISTEQILRRAALWNPVNGVISQNNAIDPPPAPDQYLLAMRETFGNRDNGVAVEDSDNGCESALAAGLSVIAVSHELNRGHQFKGARRIIGLKQMAQPAQFVSLVIEP